MGFAHLNSYLQEILGPRTFGSVLNIGAGRMSIMFRQAEMFAGDEYHTLETPGADIEATYHCYGENMDTVPSDRYDWLISTAVLEHVADPWAVAREAMRVTKPGGFIYTLTPFYQQVHVGPTYSDYWRFTPAGLEALFPGCRLREVEIWGDSPITPNAFAILVQKPPFEEAAQLRTSGLTSRTKIRGGHSRQMLVRSMIARCISSTKTPFVITNEMQMLREQINVSTGTFVPIHQIVRGSIDRYARRIGTLGFRGDTSYVSG